MRKASISQQGKTKVLVSLFLVVAIVFSVLLLIPASAATNVITSLMPSSKKTNGNLTLTGCTMKENSDGSVTFTLTADTASYKMVYADKVFEEGKGGTVYAGEAIDLSKPAFVVYDYASADGVAVSSIIAHYTRKDKAATSVHAELWLNSMEGTDYAKYSKQSGKGFGVWDWGTYVSSADAKIFANKLHRFVDVEGSFTGKVGSKITIYSYYVSSTSDVKGLGSKRPEPTATTSSVPTSSSAVSSSVVDSSITESTNSIADTSSEVSVTSESANDSSVLTESKSTSSAQSSTDGNESKSDDGGLDTIYIVLIAVAVVAAIGGASYFIFKKKK